MTNRHVSHTPTAGAVRKAAVWFSRLRGSTAGQGDRAAFARWRLKHPARARAYAEIENVWNCAGELGDDAEIQALADAADRHRAPRAARTNRYALLAGVVATVGLLLLAGGLATPIGEGWLGLAPAPATFETAAGERRVFALDDGTVVHMEGGARLSADVGGARRRIELLAGEARFNVAHDRWGRDFRVRARDVQVTALGTVFDVELRPGVIEVDLLQGSVEVRRTEDRPERLTLKPGQSARIGPADADVPAPLKAEPLTPASLNTTPPERLVFSGVSLDSVTDEVNRYSPRPLHIEHATLSALEDKRFRGVFITGDVSAIAEALCLLYGLEARPTTDGGLLLRLPRSASR